MKVQAWLADEANQLALAAIVVLIVVLGLMALTGTQPGK